MNTVEDVQNHSYDEDNVDEDVDGDCTQHIPKVVGQMRVRWRVGHASTWLANARERTL